MCLYTILALSLTRGVSEISCNSIGNAMFVPLPTNNSLKWTPSKINEPSFLNTVSNLTRNQIPITPENYIIEHQPKQLTNNVSIAGGITSDNVHFLDLSVGDTSTVNNTVIAGETGNNLNAMSNEFIPGGIQASIVNAMNNHQTLYTANMHMNHIQNPGMIVFSFVFEFHLFFIFCSSVFLYFLFYLYLIFVQYFLFLFVCFSYFVYFLFLS